MVQVLPERQTVGSAIARAIGDVGSAYVQRRQKDQLLQEYTDPNTPPARKAQIEMELPTQHLMALSKLRELQAKQQRNQGIQNEFMKDFGIDTLEKGQGNQSQQSFVSPVNDLMESQIETPSGTYTTYEQISGDYAGTPTIEEMTKKVPGKNAPYPQELIAKYAQFAEDPQAKKAVEIMQRFNDQFTQKQNTQEKIDFSREKLARQETSKNKEKLLEIQGKAAEKLKSSEDALFGLETQLEAVSSGKVGPLSLANLAESFDRAGYKTIANLIQTQEGAVFKTSGKQLFKGGKEIFGAKISDYEADILEAMQASVGKDPSANRIQIFSLMVPLLIDKEDARYRMQLIEENPEIDAVKLNSEVNKHLQNYKNTIFNQFESYIKDFRKSRNIKGRDRKKRLTLEELLG